VTGVGPRAWDQEGVVAASRAMGVTVAEFAQAMRACAPVIAAAYIEGQLRALEACGGRRPLVGEERAEHWRRILTP
jgi:hypothetical protein